VPDSSKYLKEAISIQAEYKNNDDTITDEAELLRGCLNALVAIAQILYGGVPD
jgi:hypothetical protein